MTLMTKPIPLASFLVLCSALVNAHHGASLEHQDDHLAGKQNPFIYGPGFVQAAKEPTWLEKYGPQIDQAFSGPLSFSHTPYHRCLEDEGVQFDIAILGMPFDTAVTYRPG